MQLSEIKRSVAGWSEYLGVPTPRISIHPRQIFIMDVFTGQTGVGYAATSVSFDKQSVKLHLFPGFFRESDEEQERTIRHEMGHVKMFYKGGLKHLQEQNEDGHDFRSLVASLGGVLPETRTEAATLLTDSLISEAQEADKKYGLDAFRISKTTLFNAYLHSRSRDKAVPWFVEN